MYALYNSKESNSTLMNLARASAILLLVPMSAGLTSRCQTPPSAAPKPLISLDEFMNATEILGARLSPDGHAVVIAASSPDWAHNRFREDLWLWTSKSGITAPLTRAATTPPRSGRLMGA